MSSPQPGQVQVEGLFEGPASSWEPVAETVADALRRAGAPDNLLHPVTEGGRASLEPADHLFPRGQFASDPADAVAMALQMLLDESCGGRPDDWFSTLRVITYEETVRHETLLQVDDAGVRTATRETPWSPVQPMSLRARLRSQWPVLAAIALAGGLVLWLERDRLADAFGRTRALLAGPLEVAEDVELAPGGFEGLLALDLEQDDDEVRVVVTRTDAYPQDAAALEALRRTPDLSLDRLAAINAIADGRMRVVLHFGEEDRRTYGMDLLDGEVDETFTIERDEHRGARLTAVRLQP